MSSTTVTILAVGFALSIAFTLRWRRHFIASHICPAELLFIESIRERNRVCDRGYSAFLKQWRTWVVFAISSVALALASLPLAEIVRTTTQGGQWGLAGARLAVLLPAVGQVILIPIMCLRYRKWMRVFLRDYLNSCGVPICAICGYDLRGQTSRGCPECGQGHQEHKNQGDHNSSHVQAPLDLSVLNFKDWGR